MRKPLLLLLLIVPALTAAGVTADAADVTTRAASADAVRSPRIEALLEDLARRENHLTIGMDNLVVGLIERDRGLGYPRSAWGMSPLVGITWRAYDGQPSRFEVQRAAEVVEREYGVLREREWRRRVKEEVGDYFFNYFGFATSFFVLPGFDGGVMWDFAGPDGEGLSIAVGMTWGMNTFLVPVPYVAVSYSF